MTQPFLCPQCGHNAWHAWRLHTVCEEFIGSCTAMGFASIDHNEFGETESTGEFFEITCAHCDSNAPANHPLWPRKEESHE